MNTNMEKYIADPKRYEQSDMLYQRCGRSGIIIKSEKRELFHKYSRAIFTNPWTCQD